MMAKKVTESERGILTDVVVSRVQPSSISEHPEFLYPSVYDSVNMDLYIPSVCLYRLDTADPSAFSTFIHCVKNSLSEVLSLYYPMAGKWIITEDAWIRKLFCNDEGAVFVVADIDKEMDEVLDRNDLNFPGELTGEHAVPGFKAAVLSKTSETNEYPSLIVQVTRFKCGGVALTLNFSHMTVDGYGFDRFLKAWSEIASTGQTSSKPLFDRSVSVPLLEKIDILGIPSDTKNPDDNLSGFFKIITSNKYSEVSGKVFSIRKDVVEMLRQKVNEESVSDLRERPERFTTFECVSAQIWRCFARIPKILSGMTRDDKVRFLFPVEGRRKWSNPCLPEDYFGNMFLLGCPPEFPGSQVTEKPLSFAASHIHKSVGEVNHKTYGEIVDSTLKGLREIKSTNEKLQAKDPDNQGTTLQFYISAWSRFDNFYNLDFGYGGPFSFFPCPVWNISITSIFLLPPAPKSGNAVEMYIHTPLENLNILRKDPEFIDLVS